MRVLLTSTPGWGHIHPMVPLARALVARGDELLWATGPDVCERLARDGFATAPAGLGERAGMGAFFEGIRDRPVPTRTELPVIMFPGLFGEVRPGPMLADLLPLAEAWSPDLLVCDAADFAGPLVAALVGVPNVTHGFGALLPAARVAAASEQIVALWRDHGLAMPPYGGCYEHLYLDVYPPSLQASEAPHVPARQLLRPGNAVTGSDEPLPDWITAPGGPPLVYVTFGTVFSDDALLATVVAGVRALPVRVVVTVGPHGDPASLGPQPANVHVARYLPQDRLLPHVAAVVSHAGSGTFLAALAAGLPQLCLPLAADQFLNAATCVRSATGIALEADTATEGLVRDAVARLLSEDAFRAAALGVGDEIEAMPGPDEVAERLHVRFG